MFSEKTPYVVTVVVAILGWLVTHFSDRVLDSPTIEYSIDVAPTNNDNVVEVSISNVTRDVAFKDLTILLSPADGSILSGFRVVPVEPAYEGDNPPGTEGVFTFPVIQPGWTYRVSAHFTGPTRPSLRLKNAASTIYATEPSIETFIARYETRILLVLSGIWTVILVVALWLSWRQDRQETNPARQSAGGGSP
jgi:hypothetical protein